MRPAGAFSPPTRGGLRTRIATSHRDLAVPSITLVAILCLLAGCSAASSEQPSPEPAGSPGAVSLPASIVDPVVADVARRAGVPADQVAVQSAEAVTFPDAGLGCPVPGMGYAQVQVDGYRIVAVAAGTTYDYRGTAPGTFRLCTPQK